MAPKKAARALRIASARTQKDSSDSEDYDDAIHGPVVAAAASKGAKPKQKQREAAVLDKSAVLAAVQSMGSSNPRRLPSLFNGSMLAEWEAWHEATPTSLAEIPSERRAAATFAMPMKCGPAVATGTLVPSQRTQVELLSFANKEGTQASLSKDEVQRSADALLHNSLYAADVPIGSTVALENDALNNALLGSRWKQYEGKGQPRLGKQIVCPLLAVALQTKREFTSAELAGFALPALKADSWIEVSSAYFIHDVLPPGEGTEFLLGDVRAVELRPQAANGEASGAARTAPVSRVLVHYRMPAGGRGFCDNVNSAWKLACLCRQEYSNVHERRKACRELKDNAVGSVSQERNTVAYLDWQPANRIFETQLNPLNASGSIPHPGKKRIAEHKEGWRDLLGVKAEPKGSGKRKALQREAA